jgi:uncharacterized protein
MVKVDVSQLIDHVGISQPFSVVISSMEIGEPDPWVQGDIAVAGQITNVGTVYRLIGTVTVKASFECSRCLKPLDQTLTFQFEEDFDAASLGYAKDSMDIAEPIRSALIFQEPMQPLCSDECKGLCFECGADRNLVDCGCDSKKLDPRLAALGQLLDK